MGCICSKASPTTNDDAANRRDGRGSKKLSKLFVAASKKEQVVADLGGGVDGRARLIQSPQENVIFTPISSDERDKKEMPVQGVPTNVLRQRRTTVDSDVNRREQNLRITSVPNGIVAEHISAGWPSWLTSVAGEAIRGWVPRKSETFEKLDKIGQGTYSSVYKARDLETGKIVALKKVRFVHMDPESVRFMAREIHVLRRLDHPNVIKLEGIIASRSSCSLHLIFEYMEHDLAGLAASPAIKFTEAQVKCYMKQLLLGLQHCHSRRVLHRDIKGSNLLIDDNGILRISDFGLATFFHPEQRQPLTSRVVTLWYRPPELLLGATDYGVAVDLWSSGCILAELFSGKPIMPGRTEVEQLHKIFKLCGSPSEDYWRESKLPHTTIFKPQQPYKRCVADTFKDFPSTALALLNILLAIEPAARGTADSALQSEFFTTSPLPCDPSSLPKYPPSKEYDTKVRQGEAKKQSAAAENGHGSFMVQGQRDSKKEVNPNVIPESQVASQKRQGRSMSKTGWENDKFRGESGSNFPLNLPRGNSSNMVSHSGPLLHANALGSSLNGIEKFDEDKIHPTFAPVRGSHRGHLKSQRSSMHQSGTDLSNLSTFVATRRTAKSEIHRDGSNHHSPEQGLSSRYDPLQDVEPTERQGWAHHLFHRPTSSHRKADRRSLKEYSMGYASKKNRMHYSGPLLAHGGNIEEMLREHERQIQVAVRKACLDKVKTKKNYGEQAQSLSLLHDSGTAI